jgi:hypothetical protein
MARGAKPRLLEEWAAEEVLDPCGKDSEGGCARTRGGGGTQGNIDRVSIAWLRPPFSVPIFFPRPARMRQVPIVDSARGCPTHTHLLILNNSKSYLNFVLYF